MSKTRQGDYTIPVGAPGSGRGWMILYTWVVGEPGSPPHVRMEDSEIPVSGYIDDWTIKYFDIAAGIVVDLTGAISAIGWDEEGIEESIRIREDARL